MTAKSTTSIEWVIDNVKIKITDQLEHWLKKNFSSEIDEGRIVKLEGVKIEKILENIINHHTDTKVSSITLTTRNFHTFSEIIQKNC